MRLACLASSSAGNCFCLSFDLGDGIQAAVLVECGLPYATIIRKLAEANVALSGVCGLLISHSHKDHSFSARDFDRRGFRIVATPGTMEACGVGQLPTGYGQALVIFTDGIHPSFRHFIYAQPFPVEHDAPEPAGFVIGTNKETVIFGIDSFQWLADLSSYRPDYVMVEADYDGPTMDAEQRSLMAKADMASRQRFRQNTRTMSEHMSLDRAIETARGLNLSKCKAVFLTHLSDRLAAPNAFRIKATANIGVETHVCLKNGGIL